MTSAWKLGMMSDTTRSARNALEAIAAALALIFWVAQTGSARWCDLEPKRFFKVTFAMMITFRFIVGSNPPTLGSSV